MFLSIRSDCSPIVSDVYSCRDFLLLKDTYSVHSKFVEGRFGVLDVSGFATLRQKQKKYSESFEAAEAKMNDRVVYCIFICWLVNSSGSDFEYGLRYALDSQIGVKPCRMTLLQCLPCG